MNNVIWCLTLNLNGYHFYPFDHFYQILSCVVFFFRAERTLLKQNMAFFTRSPLYVCFYLAVAISVKCSMYTEGQGILDLRDREKNHYIFFKYIKIFHMLCIRGLMGMYKICDFYKIYMYRKISKLRH